MKLRKRCFIYIFIAVCTFLLLWWYYGLVIDLPHMVDSTPPYTFFSKESHIKPGNEKSSMEETKNLQKFGEVMLHDRELFFKCHPHCSVLCVVCCGNRFPETTAMIKSAISMTHHLLVIEIFTEEKFIFQFHNWSSFWPDHWKSKVKLNIHLAQYPPNVDDKRWRNLFRECASIRLFLPSLLPHVDSLIYVDTDILFLSSVEKFWDFFHQMNSSQMVALSPEHEDAATGWYNRFARHPYYGKLGVNSGVMLMNLTRLRSFGWEEYLQPIEKEFRSKLTWGDQDIINIIFHYHPDKLLLMPCEYNYRPDHCMYMNTCKTVSNSGVMAVHGSRKVFHSDKQPVFKEIFAAWNQFKPNGDLKKDLYYHLVEIFQLHYHKKGSNCLKMKEAFLKNIQRELHV